MMSLSKMMHKMKKVIFLHGFFASGSCPLALTLKDELDGKAKVLTPDLPMNPKEALRFILNLCDHEKPDLLVGNSCGSFYAQIVAPIVGAPALLGNPHFEMSKFLSERKGEHQYKSPRRDGKQDFVIDDALIETFSEIEAQQFNYTSLYYKDRVWGLFGEQDTLAHYEPEFLKHYTVSYHFPGAHTPTVDEAKTWYVPLVEKMLMSFARPEARYFRHFKGNLYRLERTAYDSETQERMVVYQQEYGEHNFWVRPEKMFFEHVTRDGKTFSRFLETER
jgi:hypothetical protein